MNLTKRERERKREKKKLWFQERGGLWGTIEGDRNRQGWWGIAESERREKVEG